MLSDSSSHFPSTASPPAVKHATPWPSTPTTSESEMPGPEATPPVPPLGTPLVIVTTPLSDSEKINALQARLTQPMAVMQGAAAAAAATSALPVAPATAAPPAVVQPEQPPALQLPLQQQFTAPLAAYNSPAGALLSTCALFPDIEPVCITLVLMHELKATDLYKLDARTKDLEPTYSLSTTGSFDMNNTRHKAYKTLNPSCSPFTTTSPFSRRTSPAEQRLRYTSTRSSHTSPPSLRSTSGRQCWNTTPFSSNGTVVTCSRAHTTTGACRTWASSVHTCSMKAVTVATKPPAKRTQSSGGTEPCPNYNLRKRPRSTGDKTASQTCTNLKSVFESAATTAALSADRARVRLGLRGYILLGMVFYTCNGRKPVNTMCLKLNKGPLREPSSVFKPATGLRGLANRQIP
ncbi:hypothetical protein B0H16DRAFT_1455046 [Mycena metata]|uniref:Uncharacterized protein n=1 Tax=Mycena metata TaxID=1033252 RepID=A0AAD7IJN9_9AGAR|nr:hypothetical protein B0H16DRAFT_1463301 [Mycena metata]KAJ7763791.1 hypothetical protein B0H16DRAFT_1455046 [Mycena metata]